MAEHHNPDEMLAMGQRCVEQMCGSSHDIAELQWDSQEDAMSLHYWFARHFNGPREYARLSFTRQELMECPTDSTVRDRLKRRIHDAIAPFLLPRAPHRDVMSKEQGEER